MHIFKLFLLILLTVSVQAQTNRLDHVSLQLQWKHQFEFAGFYAAKEQGFYKDAGLDVTFLEHNASKNVVEEVLKGNVTFGLTYSSIIPEYIEGKPLILLANFFKRSPLILVTQPNIHAPDELKNRSVMGLSESIHNIALLSMFHKFGIKTSDLLNVKSNFNINDFVTKKVDAMTVFSTNELYYLDQKEVKYNTIDPSKYGAVFYDGNLFTSEEELVEHPSQVKRFRMASIKGWEYALAHKKEIVDLILKKYNTQGKSKAVLRFEAKQIEAIMMPKQYAVGSVDVKQVEAMAERFVQAGFLNKIVNRDIGSFVYEHRVNPLGLNEKEKAFLKVHPTIILGADADLKPYVILNKDGSVEGFDVDVLQEINRVSGANFELKVGKWSALQAAINKGGVDGLSTSSIYKEQAKYLRYSTPYITIQNMVITAKENPKNIHKLSDLKGKRIAIDKNNLSDKQLIKLFPNSIILEYDTMKDVIRSVVTDKADAMFGGSSVLYMAESMGLPYLKRAVTLEQPVEIAFAVRKDWPEAISIINKSLAYIGDSELTEIKKKWFWDDQVILKAKEHADKKLSKEEKAYLKEKKELLLCTHKNWMPFESIKDGQYIGLAADYMQEVSQGLNTVIRVVNTESWAESVEMIKAHNCDLLPMVMISDEKHSFIKYTEPYVDVPLVLATKDDQIFIQDISNYLDKVWVVLKGNAVSDILRDEYPHIKLVEEETLSKGLEMVQRGEVFGYIGDAVTISHAIKEDFFGVLSITGQVGKTLHFAMGSRSDEPLLHSILEKSLLSIDSQRREVLFNTWVQANVTSVTNYSLFFQTLAIAMLIIVIILYRAYLLQREIKKRSKVEAALHELTETLAEKVQAATMSLETKNVKLADSLHNFENVFNTVMEMIIIFEEDGTILDINRSGLKMLGYSYKDDVLHTKISSHIIEEDLIKLYEDILSESDDPYELRIVKSDGTQLHTLIDTRQIMRDGKNVRLATLIDLTELKQKSQHLVQQSKMTAMGEMIENIAHQWQEPLSEINGTVSSVEDILVEKNFYDEQVEVKLKKIETLSKYMSTAINDFRDFFLNENQVVSFVLSDTVLKAVKIAIPLLQTSNIPLTFNVSRGIVMNGYPNELKQAILVLVNNAKDALLERHVKNPKITIEVERSDEKVQIIVCDNAGGIDAGLMEKIFEPYFSTKKVSKGGGLSLYISKMIIEESMKGTIVVKNTQEGACFTITIPIES